ncbi:hypothetical protein JTE90_022107 [Oedothorax gibbosus]|nr:hypothetical protein JTE90_022107 [Oedothorax gibbosus]
MKVLIEFGDSAKKLHLEDNVSIEVCINAISEMFSINAESVKLQIFDAEFNAFCDLEEAIDIKNLSRIKVIDKTATFEDGRSTMEEVHILPAENQKNLRQKNWNASNLSFSVELFSLASREELVDADRNYTSCERLHKASYKLKREIIDIISKELACYSLYPSNDMYKSVAENLIEAFPFLRDPIGDGSSCWIIATKYRMQEVRRKAKVEEVTVNAGRQPKKGQKDIAHKADLRRKGIKKPRKGEINYNPEVPAGETLETLMDHKHQLLNEFKKREPCHNILDQKMDITYALRRQDIVKNPTTFNDFKKHWPMLFSPDMLQKEMMRLVGLDIFQNIRVNLKSNALLEVAMKTLSRGQVSEEDIVRSLPKFF